MVATFQDRYFCGWQIWVRHKPIIREDSVNNMTTESLFVLLSMNFFYSLFSHNLYLLYWFNSLVDDSFDAMLSRWLMRILACLHPIVVRLLKFGI